MDHDIDRLWQIGVLTADGIISRRKIRLKGLENLGRSMFGDHMYADLRTLKPKPNGLGGVFRTIRPLADWVALNYHPFRFYVLYKLAKNLEIRGRNTQFLHDANGIARTAEYRLEWLQDVTSSPAFYKRLEEANRVVELAISCEPVAFSRAFGFHREPVFNPDFTKRAEGSYESELESYGNVHTVFIQSLGLPAIREIHAELCRDAHFFDRNLDLQRLLRLTAKDIRMEKVKGTLGGSMYMLAMAEFVRRTAEHVFQEELPEEDEAGLYGGSGKAHFYGSSRLIDDSKAQRNFLRQFRLDRDIRLRWYVEGQTEFGAVRAVLGDHPQIEIVNLKGQIVAGHGKGLAFRENLKNDIKTSVYSWVSLDGDDENYVRALKQAVDSEEFFGLIFISTPDFEFGNFEIEELVSVIVSRAKSANTPIRKRDVLKHVHGAVSNVEFFSSLRKAFPFHVELKKDEEWGRLLFEYANEQPKMRDKKTERPIVSAIREAVHAVHTNYYYSRRDGKVDWTTGRIIYPERNA